MKLEEKLISKLRSLKSTLCLAESCTGGLIAHRITSIPGASEVFFGSWVVYHNSAKELLGVPTSLIRSKGAVSPEVAQELSERSLQKMVQTYQRSGVSISTTGIAGPRGGSPEKPVGLCYLSVSVSGRPSQVREVRAQTSLNRVEVQNFFAEQALEFCLGVLLRSL